jgi:hypothetical protein
MDQWREIEYLLKLVKIEYLLKLVKMLKLKEILTVDMDKHTGNGNDSTPLRMKDEVVNNYMDKYTEIENDSNMLKINKKSSNVDMDKCTGIEESENMHEINKNFSSSVYDKDSNNNEGNQVKIGNTENESDSTFVQDKRPEGFKNTDKKEVLKAIYNLSEQEICPSIQKLMDKTKLSKNWILEIKKEFEDVGILETKGRKTYILSTYPEALKSLEGGGVFYESS